MATITYQAGIAPLNPVWAKKLSDLMDSIGVPSVVISSTYRPPEYQARAMAANIEAKGADSQKAYYSSRMHPVIDKYVLMKKYGYGLADSTKAMAKILETLPNKSGHMNPDTVNQATFDIPPSSIPESKRRQFVALMKKNSAKFIDPAVTKGEPVYHVEFATVQKQIADKAVPVTVLLAIGAFVWYIISKGRI